MDIVGYAKAHPAQTAAIAVIGVAAIWFLLPSGSNASGGSSAAGGYSSDALLGAQLQLASMKNSANSQMAQLNADLAIAKENNSAQLALTQLQIQGQNNASAHEFDYLSYRDELTAKTELANTAANLTLGTQTLESQTKVALAGISSNVQIAQGQNQVAIAQSNNNTMIAQTLADIQRQQIVTGGQTAIAQINAGVQTAKIAASTQQQGNILGFVGNLLRL